MSLRIGCTVSQKRKGRSSRAVQCDHPLPLLSFDCSWLRRGVLNQDLRTPSYICIVKRIGGGQGVVEPSNELCNSATMFHR